MLATRVRGAGSSMVVVEETGEVVSTIDDSTIERLLVNFDTANRSDLPLVRNTVREIHDMARGSSAYDVHEVMKNVILLAFKRRNHKKSQAPGEGPGEKAIFVEALLAIIELDSFNDLIERVLPLVPEYGYWKDLRLLAEQLVLRATTSSDEVSEVLHPTAQRICVLFAEQMKKDAEETREGEMV
ncbi:hypothetical protein EON65_49385, partial [archaeon]